MENEIIIETCETLDPKNIAGVVRSKKYAKKKLKKKVKPIENTKALKKEGCGCLTTFMKIIKHIHHIYHTAKLMHLGHQLYRWAW